jgi:hypothetical protein
LRCSLSQCAALQRHKYDFKRALHPFTIYIEFAPAELSCRLCDPCCSLLLLLSLGCSHPVAVATRAVAELASNAASSDSAQAPVHLQNLQLRASALQQQFRGLTGDDLQQALAGVHNMHHFNTPSSACLESMQR